MARFTLAILVLAGSLEAQEKPKEETATLTGTVHIDGKVDRPKTVPMDLACAALHPDKVKTESTLVDDGNNVRNAFVWIKSGLEGRTYPVPTEPILVDQVGCRYTPHVFGIRVGQKLRIRNSDPFMHNVHVLPFFNKEVNFAQPVTGMVNEYTFTTPEFAAMIKCDAHSWMRTWAGVVEHPFFAVTDEKGAFTIKGLPPGKYTVGVWQEDWTVAKPNKPEVEVQVKAGETKIVGFTLDKTKLE